MARASSPPGVTPERPGPGQRSVWSFPRPPALEPVAARIQVIHHGVTLADTQHALAVLETSHAPTYYVPPADVDWENIAPSERTSFCEYKGQARYHHVELPGTFVRDAAWSYPAPSRRFRALRDHVAFYAQKLDACLVDGEAARGQAGGFYGGWITSAVTGPFKGEPGTGHW